MALVTKKSLYETIAALLEGGNSSTGKKFEPRMVQAHLQQAINRKLKLEYVSTTLPGDETIPDGLVLATYNDIPVTTYKNNLSRAMLPAMPISLRRNMGVFFVGPATGGNIAPNSASEADVIIESVIGVRVVITGTVALVVGLSDSETVLTCTAWANRLVTVIRGNIPIPSIDPEDGSNYFTKVLAETTITLNTPLVTGEYIRIATV